MATDLPEEKNISLYKYERDSPGRDPKFYR